MSNLLKEQCWMSVLLLIEVKLLSVHSEKGESIGFEDSKCRQYWRSVF